MQAPPHATLRCGLLALALVASGAAPVLVNNTAPRTTTSGDIVDSHNGGTIVAFGGRYHLYGISFGGCAEQAEGQCRLQL